MQLKFTFFLLVGLMASAHRSQGQDFEPLDLSIFQFHKSPRCGEIFPMSHYEGEMVLEEEDKEQSSGWYKMEFYEEYLSPYPEYNFEYISEEDSSLFGVDLVDFHTYKDIRLQGSFVTIRMPSSDKKWRSIITPIPDGPWEVYHTNRTTGERHLLKSMNFAGGKITGDYVVRDTLGNVLYRTVADTLGSWVARDYHPSGAIRAEGEYLHGNRNGIWTWYDEKGRVVIRESYRDGKYSSRLIPYNVSLNISVDDPGIKEGFVMLENEDDGSVDYYEYVYWGGSRNPPVLQLRDTVGINIWFCAFGHAPLFVNVEDAEVSTDGKRSLAVEPMKDVVYVGKILWNGDRSKEIDWRYHGYSLPERVDEEYVRIKEEYSFSHLIPFSYLMPLLDVGERIEFLFRVDGEENIVDVSGRSETLPARRLERIVRYMQKLRGLRTLRHRIDHRNEYTYSVTLENAVEYSPSQRRRSYKRLRAD